MMNKYIVRNCPNLTTSWYSDGTKLENQCGITDEDLCKDRKFCLLKKVVDKCRYYQEYVSDEILDLFEIEEVKEC